MSKNVHPIRKMQVAIRRATAYESRPDSFVDAVAARHVKPLLDQLDQHTKHHHGGMGGCSCEACRLLVEWSKL